MLYRTGFYVPFLLVCLLLYWLAARTSGQRMALLAAASGGFLVLAEAPAVGADFAWAAIGGAILLAVAVFAWGRRLREGPAGRPLLVAAILVPLLVLAYFKYVSAWLPAVAIVPAGAIPLGMSYYTFKHVHYVVECRRGKFRGATIGEYLAYVLCFPMFVAGPIERFTTFAEQARRAAWSGSEASLGVERILIGLGKKFLLVNLLLQPMLPAAEIIADGAPGLAWYQALAACFVKLLYTYLDFSGYTDMVLGTARVFGFRLMENFDFPLLRANLGEFWRSWHISLSSWARDYVYFPLLGRTRAPAPALLATMLTIGMWHGAQPGWACWGLHHGVGLVVFGNYRRWAEARPAVQRLRATAPWRVLSTALVWWFVSLGYALTFDPGGLGGSLRLYVKVATLGLIS